MNAIPILVNGEQRFVDGDLTDAQVRALFDLAGFQLKGEREGLRAEAVLHE